MALISTTSLAGAVLLLYLSSFVLLAALRIATGISIQRVGYLSLRHISYSPHDGLRITLRGLGLSFHRPTFAQPTWISLVLSDLRVTLDPTVSSDSSSTHQPDDTASTGPASDGIPRKPVAAAAAAASASATGPGTGTTAARSDLWKKLSRVKEQLKRLHSKIKWLRTLDVSVNNTSLDILGVGTVSVGALTMAVHTRKKLLDRGRLFRHKKDAQADQKAAEWIFSIKSVMLGVDGMEPVEVLDAMFINIHGLLFKDLEGLRDTSIAVKAGRLYVPLDDLLQFSKRRKRLAELHTLKAQQQQQQQHTAIGGLSPISEAAAAHTPTLGPGTPLGHSREASIVQTVDDSKEFFSSILRGVQEIQIGLSFIRVSKELQSVGQAESPLVANLVTHEIGIDLHRLDQNTPAHRMSFSRDDVAHQALLAAVSLSVTLDEDDAKAYRILYVPMATTTVSTTLPSKTIDLADEADIAKRNTNILIANLVVTSPSVDLVPQQLIRLLALFPPGRRSHAPKAHSAATSHRHRVLSRLLPKASIKFSVHEPVVRFVLPVSDPAQAGPDEYDMIISAVSSIYFEAESSHSTAGDPLYSLASTFRLVSHQLYYQDASGTKHNLIHSDSLELRINVTVSTEVLVLISGSLTTFSVLMVREEVSKGVYNIVRHFKRRADPDARDDTTLLHPPKPSFLRRMPPWLLEFHFEGTNCSAQTAGVDDNLSTQTRGLALELASWTVDYRSQHADAGGAATWLPSSRRKHNSSGRREDSFSNVHHLSPPTSPAKPQTLDPTDGRRLTVHARGLDGFIIEGLDHWESQPFLSIPRFEVACSTSRDAQGQIFHVNSAIRSFYLDFSLYRFYSIGVAGFMLKHAFFGTKAHHHGHSEITAHSQQHHSTPTADAHQATTPTSAAAASTSPPSVATELVTIDVKATLIQVKAHLPADPPLMLQLSEVSAGRHRWSAPFFRCTLARLHVEAPRMKHVWARLVTTNNLRLDLRHHRKRTAQGQLEEKSVDLTTDLVRLSNPNGLRMYHVFDNISNTVKSLEQLIHRFKTASNDYVLHKGPKSPVKVPRVTLRTKALMIELEDDPFEWKLGNIYHIGRVEQKLRLARAHAFNLKVRKMHEEKLQRTSTRYRAQSAHARPSPQRDGRPVTPTRSRSQDSLARGRSSSRTPRVRGRSHKIRYDRDGTCAFTGDAKVTADEAWAKLQEYNSTSWKQRFDTVMARQNNTIKNIRKLFITADQVPHDVGETENILDIPRRPGLMSIVISDVHLIIDKPSFPLPELPQFLHEIGKGMPYSMQYALSIPMNLSLDMGEARVFLRDYPLNLLHIPALRSGQSPRLPSWSFRSDFVIAEEFRDEDSIRHVKVDIVPKGQRGENGEEVPGFSIDVRRTVSPVKIYSRPVIDINTSLPTTISWGQSYQPVIQDMMDVLENFTKPEIDPSDRIGFWDKIRMSFHSRLTINWKGDGDLQLRLKGSRDPYSVTGHGAGFVMCWRNNVQWLVHADDDPQKFMTVTSGEYFWAIPDYSNEARKASDQPATEASSSADHESRSLSSSSGSGTNNALFQKVIMKLTGRVQWKLGLVFERDLNDGSRTSSFIPHYDVIMRNPLMIPPASLPTYDSFRGFRSNHIHMSIGVAAPFDRDWTSLDTTVSESYNSVHLSPRFFSHFYDWWSLFSGVMSLPVRQGSLWRGDAGPEKSSKKFGRHLATIKYGLLLSPLFIAHVYKHKDAEDYQEDHVSATGLKLRLDSFVLDLHSRREWFNTVSKTKSKQMRTSAIKINQVELDFVRADLRAVSANIGGTTAEDLRQATDDPLTYQKDGSMPDLSRFDIPDLDYTWIDMDDFVELDWILPTKANPETRILPLAFTPRFTYFRQTDHGDSIQGDASRTSPFGNEHTHACMMSNHNDPRKVQIRVLQNRLRQVNEKIVSHRRLLGENELRVVRDGAQDPSLKVTQRSLERQKIELDVKQAFLEYGLRRLGADASGDDEATNAGNAASSSSSTPDPDAEFEHLFSASQDEFSSNFNNRFIVHNIQLKWNNAVRNTILRYSHQVIQRRGFVYYRSRRAVKFILDIVEEQARAKAAGRKTPSGQPLPTATSAAGTIAPTSEDKDDDVIIQDRIDQLLSVAHRFVNADDSEAATDGDVDGSSAAAAAAAADSVAANSSVDDGEALGENGNDKIADNFLPVNSYHLRLISPQIQLQSEKNTSSVVLVSAKGIQLKIVSIMDKSRLTDEVSGLVQRRYTTNMDGAQFFVSTQKLYSKFLHLHSSNSYGCAAGVDWPPWVPVEAMYDFDLNPFGFQRVIQKTSASLRYEQYNPLRLKYNEEVGSSEAGEKTDNGQAASESRINGVWVDFPRIRAICDSAQYYTIYLVVLDLLLYSEPLEKTRSERLEKIMLASDFSDLRGAPEMTERLQDRIRQLDELKLYFQINAKDLDKQGWKDRIDLEKDLANCEDELFFIMKAINTSQQRIDDRKTAASSGLLRWYLSANEIVWHLMREKDDPLLEFQLHNAAYERIDNTDGSNRNALEIEHIRGWNLLKDAQYPDIIGPYHEEGSGGGGGGGGAGTSHHHHLHHKHQANANANASSNAPHKMAAVHWYMLEAIAGIPVLEDFEVTMHALKVQLERELGKKLFEYIFPNVDSATDDEESGRSTESLKTPEWSNEGDNDDGNVAVVNDDDDDDDDDGEEEEDEGSLGLTTSLTHPLPTDEADGTAAEGSNGKSSLGSITRRLRPTYNLDAQSHHLRLTLSHAKHGAAGANSEHLASGIKLFRHDSNRPDTKLAVNEGSDSIRKSSSTSLSSFRKGGSSTPSITTTKADDRKWGLHRTATNEHRASSKHSSGGKGGGKGGAGGGSSSNKKQRQQQQPTDDVSQMVARASNYMTLAHVKLNGFVVCLSYKGKGNRNIEDLRDFVFRLPTLEYTNKTWSNLDLALRLKKDIIRALISHTGAIIGNKFSHHRSSKKLDSSRNHPYSSSRADSFHGTPATSETTSLYSHSEDGVGSSQLSLQSTQVGSSGGGPTSKDAHGLGIGAATSLIRKSSSRDSSLLVGGSGGGGGGGGPESAAVPATGSTRPIRANAREASVTTIRASPAHSHGRNLLKDTLGKRFTHDPNKRAVHFGRGDGEKHHEEDEGGESDPEGHKKRSSVVQKVLGKLG